VRVLHRDRQAGTWKLMIETLDDLWSLRNLIRIGDLVTMSTVRTQEASGDKVRAEKLEKRPMTLGLRVNGVEWHDFDDHLRVHGTIETGPQDLGRHHTHIVRENMPITVQKPAPLEGWQMDLVSHAEAAAKRPQVILLAIDDSEAQLAVLRAHGLQMLGSMSAGGQGKQHDGASQRKKQFYQETAQALGNLRQGDEPLLVVGPGWWRTEFLDFLREYKPDLLRGAKTDGTAHGGRTGIHEALKRGMLRMVVTDHALAKDTELMEILLSKIATDNASATYGPDEVAKAIRAGATETVLITDEVARSGGHDALLKLAEELGASIHILSTAHDAGRQLRNLSGVAAILRFAYS